jgi:hypothetical protein
MGDSKGRASYFVVTEFSKFLQAPGRPASIYINGFATAWMWASDGLAVVVVGLPNTSADLTLPVPAVS